MKTYIWIAIALLVVAGGLWYLQQDAMPAETMEQAIGEGQEIDVADAVRENIIGAWRSMDDAKFVREFKADGMVVDSYEGSADVEGEWRAFSEQSPIEVGFPLEADTAYIQITADASELLHFKLAKLTPEELELIYMDRGGVLRFERIQ